MGSERSNRNFDFEGFSETNDESYLHLVIVYNEDATINLYHNGTQYGNITSKPSSFVQRFSEDTSRFVFCHRHFNAGGGSNPFNITYAAYYNYALNSTDVASLYCNKFIPSGESQQYLSDVLHICPSNAPTFIPTDNPSTQPSNFPSNTI